MGLSLLRFGLGVDLVLTLVELSEGEHAVFVLAHWIDEIGVTARY